MATRGTQFGRVMAYFREADIDEALAALNRASQIVGQRETKVVNPPQRRARKAKGTIASEPGLLPCIPMCPSPSKNPAM